MKIALLGYGKMGKAVEEDAVASGHEIILKINGAQSFSDKDLKQADVAIDFSTPAAVLGNIYRCLDAGLPVVVGTTGWYDQLPLVTSDVSCRKAALFYASNFSVGVNILFQLNEVLAEVMNDFPEYEVEIGEAHHSGKLDAPSGTALTLAEGILRFNELKNGWKSLLVDRLTQKAELQSYSNNVSSLSDDRQSPSPIAIRSVREGEVKGFHEVRYTSADDRIVLSHEAYTRKGFAQGAVLAAEWVVDKNGIFNMRDLLGFVHKPLQAE